MSLEVVQATFTADGDAVWQPEEQKHTNAFFEGRGENMEVSFVNDLWHLWKPVGLG